MLIMFRKNNQILDYLLKFEEQICQIINKQRIKFIINLHLLIVLVWIVALVRLYYQRILILKFVKPKTPDIDHVCLISYSKNITKFQLVMSISWGEQWNNYLCWQWIFCWVRIYHAKFGPKNKTSKYPKRTVCHVVLITSWRGSKKVLC